MLCVSVLCNAQRPVGSWNIQPKLGLNIATMTNAEIEQKMARVEQLAEEVKLLYDELVEAGAWPENEDYSPL